MITPMTRVEIVCLSEVRAAMIHSLQSRGVLHLEEVPTEQEIAPAFLQRVQLEGAAEDEYLRIEEVERKLNESGPLLTCSFSRDQIQTASKSVRGWSEESWNAKVAEWSEGLREKARQKGTIQDQLDVLQNYRGILNDVMPAVGGADVTLGKGTRALVLTGNVKKSLARLEERFQEELGDSLDFHRRIERKRIVGLLSFPEDKEDLVNRILSQEGIAPIDMRDESFENATIGEVIKRIDATVKAQRAALSTVTSELESTSQKIGAELLALKAIVADRISQLRVQGQFARSEMVTVVHAWVPSDFYRDLEKAIERDFSGQAVVSVLSQEGVDVGRVPTLLKNRPFFKPFEVVLSLFQPPTYGTVDPTTLVGVSFIFFYGFILGDVGYAVVIYLLARWLGNKFGHIHPAIVSAATIGKYMAISGAVFGVIYGEYFGNFGERLFETMGMHLPLLFHRSHEKIQLLILAVLVGVVHIPLALVLGIREDFRHHHSNHALEKMGMLFGLIALMIGSCAYFGVFPFTEPALLYFAIGIFVVGVGLIFKTMGAMGMLGVLEILSLGSNVLSYARLMALGTAAIAIADIANDLPASMGILLGVPMAVMVHALNIGLSVASPTIHSLRLNFVEFLPKFYNPAGKSYNPFKKETQW